MTTHAIAQFILGHPEILQVELDTLVFNREHALEVLTSKNKLWPDAEISRAPDWKILTIKTNQE